MKQVKLLTGFILWFIGISAWSEPVVHHDFDIRISPKQAAIEVMDTLLLPTELAQTEKVHFLLHADLEIDPTSANISKTPATGKFKTAIERAAVPVKHYTAKLSAGQNKITVKYYGTILHQLEQAEKEYARSFSETAGLISEQGVYLANSTVWYPQTDELVSFNMTVRLPPSWTAISQGNRTGMEKTMDQSMVTWEERHPQDEIYLIAGHFKEYSQSAGSVKALVYLREADDALAQKYLDTTGQYLNMYSKLLGPYPYGKFAMIENFWETGYGMPSFTLLGPKVLRFPFILHSSYPHEILHNWWGNGVYVDYDSGNWAEGLTAYLADHLIKEQRGKGAEYRRSVLQKYTDYVIAGRDFPLTDFRGRHSSSTAAVGYGKTLMFFHMLRQRLGEEDFIRALRTLYRQRQFKVTSFNDLQRVFADASETRIDHEFEQWINKAGAPSLRINNAQSQTVNNGYLLRLELEQVQNTPLYNLTIPIAISIEGQETAYQTTIAFNQRKEIKKLSLPGRPLRVDVDPEFDLFRRLDAKEIPAALSQGFGAEKVLVLLPSSAGKDKLDAYRNMAKTWQKNQEGQWEIALDKDYESIPDDRATWLFGWDNRFHTVVSKGVQPFDSEIENQVVTVNGKKIQRQQKKSILLTARHATNPQQTILWLASDNLVALPGLTRKLPHYRKYSYLAFEGDEPSNILKGQWPVLQSPMSKIVQPIDGSRPVSVPATLASRQALAQLPPAFSPKRMMKDIEFLAGDALAGRGLGTNALNEAAEFIAHVFKESGLKPGGENGEGFFQVWQQDVESKRNVTLKNVIGILPGINPELQGQSLIVSAHYDHLGKGWPDVHKGDEGKIHYGADDNASGVSVMLELIRQIGKKWKPQRSIIFIAFTGEEAGRLGSVRYVDQATRFPISQVIGVVNLDTVGRLGENPVTAFGTGSATEWVHIFRGIGFVSGINVKSVANDFGFSDQKSFIDAGVPAVQLFGSVHGDFHRPGDTIKKIDQAGLVKVAVVLKETVEYLANREELLTVTLTATNNQPAGKDSKAKGRKVSFGTVPDFSYQGKGVKITGTVPDSPAQIAGLLAGDILVILKGKNINDLADYARILRSMHPGDNTTLTYLRDGKEYSVNVTVRAR